MLLLGGSPDAAARECTGLVETHCAGVVAASRRLIEAARRGDLPAVEQLSAEVAGLHEDLMTAYRLRAVAFARSRQFHAAVDDLTRCLLINPDLEELYLDRSRARRLIGDFDTAVADLSEYLSRVPDSVLALRERGELYQRQGDFDRARDDFREALRFAPDSARLHAIYALTLCLQTGDTSAADALARAVRALAGEITAAPAAQGTAPAEPMQDESSSGMIAVDEPPVDTATERTDVPAAVEVAELVPPAETPDRSEPAGSEESGSDPTADVTGTPRVNEPAELERRDEALPDTVADIEEAHQIRPTHPVSSEATGGGGQRHDAHDATTGPLRRTPGNAGQVRLTCPNCGATGRVAWNRLHKFFRCARCESVYKTDGVGHLTAVRVVPVSADDPAAARDKRPALRVVPGRSEARSFPRWLAAAVVALAVVGTAAAVTGWQWPNPLERRGAQAARAWIAQDLPRLQACTDPAAEPQLAAWLAHNPPPEVIRPDRLPWPAVEVSIRRTDGASADLALRIGGKSADGSPFVIQVFQHWVARNGTWYFRPDAGRPGPRSGSQRSTRG